MAVNDAGGRKLNTYNLKQTKGSKSKIGSSSGASKVGKTSVAKMKKLKKSQDPIYEFDSDVDEN